MQAGRWLSWCGPGLWAAWLVAGVVAVLGAGLVCGLSFTTYGEEDLSLPACSRDLCHSGSSLPCRYTDSPCRGKYCNKRCGEWYDSVVANDGVPLCTCEKFCAGACYSPTCTACRREELPLWIRDIAGPLGTGLLCCPHGGGPGSPEPCCGQGHREKYGSCCELEAPSCECAAWSEPISWASFDPRSIGVAGGLALFAALVAPALLCCRRAPPRGAAPRWADAAVVAAYGAAVLAATLEAKRNWQLKFKPAELLPAGACGTLTAFAFSLVLLPLDRTHVLFRLTRIPFERTVKFHRMAGRSAVLLVVLHGLGEAYVLGAAQMVTMEYESWGFGNVFGLVAGVASVLLAATAVSRVRRANYEVFLVCHRLLAGVAYVAAAVHCLAFAAMAAVCLGLHAAGWLARLARRTGWCQVCKAERLGAADVDGEAVLLQIAPPCASGRAPEERLRPGAWFLLQAKGEREWHPYSVAAEGDGKIAFLIKDMGKNSWSSRMVAAPPAEVRLEGPYGGPGYGPGQCSALVLVGGGVGITPLARLWQHPPPGVTYVELIWVVRSPEAVAWLASLLPAFSGGGTASGRVRVFVTRQAQRERTPAATWGAGAGPTDSISVLGACTNFDLKAGFKDGAGPVGKQAAARSSRDGASFGGCGTSLALGGGASLGDGASLGGGCGGTDLRSPLSAEAAVVFPEGDDPEWQRQASWEMSRQVTEDAPDAVRQAAALPWDAEVPPAVVADCATVQPGRPDLPAVFAELAPLAPRAEWGVIACGPAALVAEARRAAEVEGMRFHFEEFAW